MEYFAVTNKRKRFRYEKINLQLPLVFSESTESSSDIYTVVMPKPYCIAILRFMRMTLALIVSAGLACVAQQLPHATPTGYELPNGWRLSPLGRAIPTE